MKAPERKTEAINLRFSPRMKALLRVAAAREHRTLSNMIEHLIIDYCERAGIPLEGPACSSSTSRKRAAGKEKA